MPAHPMLAYFSEQSARHNPSLFFRRGKTIAFPETQKRMDVLQAAAIEAGCDMRAAYAFDSAILTDVHTPDYLDFLETAWARRFELDQEAEELLTTQFSNRQMHRRPDGLPGLLGFYTTDTSTPIVEGTWAAARGAADAALCAADKAWSHGAAYALCRPPGHHAFSDCAGGFCYLNNTAIAAERLTGDRRRRVAIVDIDVHHGNGTQAIFYERADVLTVSLHADPNRYFPYFAGYAEEMGAGPGEGCNVNLPIAHGSGDDVFLAKLETALMRVRAFAPDALVVALGLDAAEDDPLGVLDVTTAGFAQAAEQLAQLKLPTAIVQEGGYLCPALPINLIAFLNGFKEAHVVSGALKAERTC